MQMDGGEMRFGAFLHIAVMEFCNVLLVRWEMN